MNQSEAERYVLISTDGHAGADILGYKPYLEARWHEEFDAWARTFSDRWGDIDPENDDDRFGVSSFLSPINWKSGERLKNVEREGIVAEVLFPNTVPPFYPSGVITAPGPRTPEEYDRRWAGARAHNRWLADFCSDAPGRRAGIAQIFLTNIEDAIEEVRWAREAGLMGILLPGDHLAQMANIYYTALEPLWDACADLDMPVHRHGIIVGEAAGPEAGLGAPAIGMYEALYFARRALPQLIFAGILERHQGLKFVFTEDGAEWVVSDLAEIQAFCDRASDKDSVIYPFGGEAIEALSKSAYEYFAQSCWLGSPLTGSDVKRRHEIGVDRIMWGADYPHHEGTAPFTLEALRANFADVPRDEVLQMTSLNAARVYGFDLDLLRPIADRIGPTVAQVAQPLLPNEYPEGSICPSFISDRPFGR